MINKKLLVSCPTGIHLRPAGVLSNTALKYKSDVSFMYKDGKIANAKSMFNILAAGIKCGDEIEIICDGEDESTAIEDVYNSLMEALND